MDPLLIVLIQHTKLSIGGPINGHLAYGLLDFQSDSILRAGFLPTDFLEGPLSTALVKLFKPVKTVS